MGLITETTYTINSEIIYDAKDLIVANVTFIGGAGGSTALAYGTVVGMITASKKYAAYATANTDGTGVAAGILLTNIPALAENATAVGVIAIKGSFIKDKLIGYDADALVDLKGREVVLDANKTIVAF